jgi:hypothetical protein
MKTKPSRFLILLAVVCLTSSFTSPRGVAQPDSRHMPPPMVIEIADGKIFGTSENGKPLPATLRNIVPLFEKRHRDLSITMVGVENVLIDKITLRIASRPPALDIAFAALAEASGRKFRAQRFGESDILLVSDPQGGPARGVEIFNLSSLLGSVDIAVADRRIREMEVMLAVLRKQLGEDHGRVADVKTDLAIAAALRANPAQPNDSTKVIEDIKEAVVATLNQLKLPEPEFRFHPGTHLFIVIGSGDAIDVTRKVIAALEKTPHP